MPPEGDLDIYVYNEPFDTYMFGLLFQIGCGKSKNVIWTGICWNYDGKHGMDFET